MIPIRGQDEGCHLALDTDTLKHSLAAEMRVIFRLLALPNLLSQDHGSIARENCSAGYL